MDFDDTPDQRLLRDSVERYLQRNYDHRRRAAILREGGFSAAVWKDFAQFGWLGAALPEDAGGFGGGAEESALLMEAFGRHQVLEPYLSTVVIGATLLQQGLSGPRRDAWLGRLVEGDLRVALAAQESDTGRDYTRIKTRAVPDKAGWRLDGYKPVVTGGGDADLFLVTASTAEGLGLFAVPREAPGLAVRRFLANDGQPAASLQLDAVAVDSDDRLGGDRDATELLERVADHAGAALCAEVVGSTAYLVEQTCAYLKTREQYGAPLANFQVLQHRLADLYVEVELTRSMSHLATAALDRPATQRMRDVSAARLQSIRCARLVGREAVQMHGGMGMSEELDVSSHFKRLAVSTLLYGDEAFHLARLAALSQ